MITAGKVAMFLVGKRVLILLKGIFWLHMGFPYYKIYFFLRRNVCLSISDFFFRFITSTSSAMNNCLLNMVAKALSLAL